MSSTSHASRHAAGQHRPHRLLTTALGAGATWLFAVYPRSPFLRRFQNAGVITSASDSDIRRLVPNVPFAHRGLHDAGSGYPAAGPDALSHAQNQYCALARRSARAGGYGRQAEPRTSIAPENSLAAFEAACRAGYGIELDLQLTADGQVVVFHDDDLLRATGTRGTVWQSDYADLHRLVLFDGLPAGSAGFSKPVARQGSGAGSAAGDASPSTPAGPSDRPEAGAPARIPLFSDVLRLVRGRVPLIIEYKARAGRVPDALLEAGDRLLRSYPGAYVVESFDPMAMGWYRFHRPRVLRGQLMAADALRTLVPTAPKAVSRLVDRLGGAALADCVSRPDFIAIDWHLWGSTACTAAGDLGAQRVAWTVRSPEDALDCVDRFDRVIFEGYIPQ